MTLRHHCRNEISFQKALRAKRVCRTVQALQKRGDNMVHQEKLSKSVNWDLSALEKALPETATQVPATTLSHLHIPFSFEIPVPCDPAPYQPASTHLFPLTFLACTISNLTSRST